VRAAGCVAAGVGVDAVAVQTNAEEDVHGRPDRALAGEEPRHGRSQAAESPSWLVLVTQLADEVR
jgi:hypothetical protein